MPAAGERESAAGYSAVGGAGRVAGFPDPGRRWHRPNPVRIFGMADREDPYSGCAGKQVVASAQLMAQHEALVAPFFHRGVDLELVAVAARQQEVALGGDDRRADDAAGFPGLAPVRHAGGAQEVTRAGVEPGEEVGMEGDAARVAVAEFDLDPEDVLHRVIRRRRCGPLATGSGLVGFVVGGAKG